MLQPSSVKDNAFGFISIRNNTDNLAYLFYNNNVAFCFDAACPYAIDHALSCQFEKQNYQDTEIMTITKNMKRRKLVYAFTTHWHLDHSGGNEELKLMNTETIFVDFLYAKNNNKLKFDVDDFVIKLIETPCHTLDSLCFYIMSDERNYLITGDFIFKLGCGRFFEGDGEMFLESLEKLEREVDPETLMLYGHDYYEIQERFTKQFYDVEGCDGFFLTFSMERKYNPFFNYERLKHIQHFKDMNEIQFITELRRMKNEFK